MAENKKRENVAEITGYEAALVKALEAAVRNWSDLRQFV